MISHNKTTLLGAFFLGAMLLFSSNIVLSQNSEDSERPQNSHKSRYGDRWECNRGFLKENKKCIIIKVPENAYLNSSGGDWRCRRGYKKENLRCLPINVPDNGYLLADSTVRAGNVTTVTSPIKTTAKKLLFQKMDT